MVDRDELLCDTLEEFLLECTGDKVEEVSELPKMLADIFYLSDKEELLEQTTRCEILDIDDGFVTYDEVVGDEIHIHYSLDFILQTSIGPEPVWRVQGSARMELSIPDITVTDWSRTRISSTFTRSTKSWCVSIALNIPRWNVTPCNFKG